jgi:hypothetical protein
VVTGFLPAPIQAFIKRQNSDRHVSGEYCEIRVSGEDSKVISAKKLAFQNITFSSKVKEGKAAILPCNMRRHHDVL